MTLEEIIKVRQSLEELVVDPRIDFAPAYESVSMRRREALHIVNQEISQLRRIKESIK